MRNIDGYFYDRMSPAWLKTMVRKNEDKWQNFTDEELVRWIYLELGKQFSFSRKYRYAITAEEKAKIELAAKDVVMRPRRINDPSSVICIDVEETMQMLLTDLFGINSRVVTDGSGPHVYLEAVTGNAGRIRLDLQQDLYNIKAGRKTEYFAKQSNYDGRYFMTISDDEIQEMDKKLGYIGEDGKYMEDYLEEYRQSIQSSETPKEKLEKIFILLEAKFFDKLKNMKYCERTELYKKVIKDMMPDVEVGHRTFRNNRKLLSCFIVPGEDDTESYFLYNKAKRSYGEISSQEYNKLYEGNEEVIKKAVIKEPRIDE